MHLNLKFNYYWFNQNESHGLIILLYVGMTAHTKILYTTKKVSHPIRPVLPLNPCAFCQYSNAIQYEYRVYKVRERLKLIGISLIQTVTYIKYWVEK
jgi:hypothetical protein